MRASFMNPKRTAPQARQRQTAEPNFMLATNLLCSYAKLI
jgi:hypothetical protein